MEMNDKIKQQNQDYLKGIKNDKNSKEHSRKNSIALLDKLLAAKEGKSNLEIVKSFSSQTRGGFK